ncbi:MAG: hypothetical protein AB1921_06370 [Thermodesulfobacteriota bacterium]
MKNITLTLSDTNSTKRATASLTLSGEQARALETLLAEAKNGLYSEHAAVLGIEGLGKATVTLNVADLS